jgi:transposase-like protein
MRLRHRAEERRRFWVELNRSGDSVRAVAKRVGMPEATECVWKKASSRTVAGVRSAACVDAEGNEKEACLLHQPHQVPVRQEFACRSDLRYRFRLGLCASRACGA